MVFSSLTFLFLFLPLILLLYYIPIGSIHGKNLLLFFASMLFYAIGEPVYILVMIASICVSYFIGLALGYFQKQKRRKTLLLLGIIYHLSILFIFKYQTFALSYLAECFNFSLPHIPLPIGISFYTFQSLSYLIDVYRKTTAHQKNLLHLGLYIAFFPQLIAGPIVRYDVFELQITQRTLSLPQISEGIQLFLVGMGKKVLFANQLGIISQFSFLSPQTELSVAMAWLGALCYTLQIYYDFSGYSDMARGLALMFGFVFPLNFNYPFMARSITDFWRRWHISLVTWFRDYVYFPIGGSKVKHVGYLLRNLFVVWMLTGLWHGASIQYIAWGFLFFLALSFEKLSGLPQKLKSPFSIALYQGFTLILLVIGIGAIFGEVDLHGGFTHIISMFHGYHTSWIDTSFFYYIFEYRWVLIGSLLFATPVIPAWETLITTNYTQKIQNLYLIAKACVLMGILILSISYLAIGAHNPFIYFTF